MASFRFYLLSREGRELGSIIVDGHWRGGQAFISQNEIRIPITEAGTVEKLFCDVADLGATIEVPDLRLPSMRVTVPGFVKIAFAGAAFEITTPLR